MVSDQFESLETLKKRAASVDEPSPEYDQVYIEDLTVGDFSTDRFLDKPQPMPTEKSTATDSYGIDWSKTSSVEKPSKVQSTDLSDISEYTESGINLENVRKIIEQDASATGHNQADRASSGHDNQFSTHQRGRTAMVGQETDAGFFKKMVKHGIENVHDETHNHMYDSNEKTVLLCSIAGKDSSDVAGTWDHLEESSATGLSSIVRNWKLRKKKLGYVVALVVNEHPLVSEDELLALARDTQLHCNQKISRGRLRRALSRLKLSTGYERFRHYIRG